LAHEAEHGLAHCAEVPRARSVLLPRACLATQAIVGPLLDVRLAVAVEPAGPAALGAAGLKLGVFPRELGALARHQPALPFDLRPLAGDLPRGRLAPGGRLLLGPVGELAIDPGSEAAVDPFVAEIEDVVDPLAQAFLAVTLVPRGRRAPRLDLLL